MTSGHKQLGELVAGSEYGCRFSLQNFLGCFFESMAIIFGGDGAWTKWTIKL